MKELKHISLQSFTLIPVDTEKEAELVLSPRDSIADFVSLGTLCLYKSITGDSETNIKVAKIDLSSWDSGITAYTNNKEISIPHDSFINIACELVKPIIDYIVEKPYINNMILGPMISTALSMYMLGEDIGMGNEPHLKSVLRGILPTSWDMTDSLEAQRVALNLIYKMFEIIVEPTEF